MLEEVYYHFSQNTPSLSALITVFHAIFVGTALNSPNCRSQPGDASFPNPDQIQQFNSSIGGRLVPVIPTGKLCQNMGGCTDDQWNDPAFREVIPGSMLQDFVSNPPSICYRNTTNCGQGSVPILGINATCVADIQEGVRFAHKYNLRTAIKASGHDYLGRSTAKNSLLLWTHNFKNITFHDSFKVGGKDLGSAVTVGSGVQFQTLYEETKARGKIFVGGTVRSVVAAGGYLQGGGHSILSPRFGLGSDNALEFQVVIANGSLITASEVEHPDLFWAIRGGGAGSWGVIISATLRTYPTFPAVVHTSVVTLNSSEAAADLASLHASHIFDWDDQKIGHYFILLQISPSLFIWAMISLWPNASEAAVNASLAPFLDRAVLLGTNFSVNVSGGMVNDQLGNSDQAGINTGLGSRLIPEQIYRGDPLVIRDTYKQLFDAGASGVLGHMVGGGQVSENAHIDSAVQPKWRTAKAHIALSTSWNEDATPAEVKNFQQSITKVQVPILDKLAGGLGSGSYSNEGDAFEPNFQVTFYGPNYARLSAIKRIYDPDDLFIVATGVGSERWDSQGLCRVG
ncbi:FAD-binding domain-containing protein [Hysterangium stoloniferum]|nr:FAD-binding domain-containing protein [Hysterangium stoloniferum]